MRHTYFFNNPARLGAYLVLALLTALLPAASIAQINEQAVSFRTPSIELVFQPPLRTGINSENPSNIEVPRLNLLVNLFENYLQYLGRLQKIATGTSLRLVYAPELAIENGTEDHKAIRLNETGLNTCLSQINQYFKDRDLTDSTYHLESADSLFTIPDQLPRPTSKVAIRTELTNHSYFQKSLEPDTDFCVIDDNRVITARPFQRSNRLFFDDRCRQCLSRRTFTRSGPQLVWRSECFWRRQVPGFHRWHAAYDHAAYCQHKQKTFRKRQPDTSVHVLVTTETGSGRPASRQLHAGTQLFSL
ncbi:MAG: hypothetical protein GQF41_2846 [Candidatus Rifleibacterium amylolyticum]|nr:MAG: hypothetical protein GQF41_2846 [Candidatus Rifleibacterium amylolyticum]